MRSVVLEVFPKFTERFEGLVRTMYLDVRCLVTIGYGCLIDPVGLAMSLPFKHRSTGLKATPEDILRDWNRVKSQPHLAKLHWKHAAAHCQLMVDRDGADALLYRRVALFETSLQNQLTAWHSWPANAQLATMSMAWAKGPGFPTKLPEWLHSAQKQDWEGCAENCKMRSGGNPGLIPRNKANAALFKAAMTSNPNEVTPV